MLEELAQQQKKQTKIIQKVFPLLLKCIHSFLYFLFSFPNSTPSFPDKLNMMTPGTSVLHIFPVINAKRHPKQAKRKQEQKHAHQPNEQPIPISFVSVCDLVANYTMRKGWNHRALFDYDHPLLGYGRLVARKVRVDDRPLFVNSRFSVQLLVQVGRVAFLHISFAQIKYTNKMSETKIKIQKPYQTSFLQSFSKFTKIILLFLASTAFPFLNILDLMALDTSKLHIFPGVNEKCQPTQNNRENQQDKEHYPNQRSIPVRDVSVCVLVTVSAHGNVRRSWNVLNHNDVGLLDYGRLRMGSFNLHCKVLLVDFGVRIQLGFGLQGLIVLHFLSGFQQNTSKLMNYCDGGKTVI